MDPSYFKLGKNLLHDHNYMIHWSYFWSKNYHIFIKFLCHLAYDTLDPIYNDSFYLQTGPAWILGDNQNVFLNTTIPWSGPKKKQNAISFHLVREGIAGRITMFNHIKSEHNYADVLTKPLPGAKFHPLIKELLFWNP